MAIQVPTIITQVESALDATGFDRYTWEDDFKPAINYSKDWLVSAFNRVFAKDKKSEETLRELIYVDVIRTNNLSRILLSETQTQTGRNLWSIKAIYPKIDYVGTLTDQTDLSVSMYSENAIYENSYKSASRKTLEQINANRHNPFSAGNNLELCEDYLDYAYVMFENYVQIYPAIPNEDVGFVYLAYPSDVSGNTPEDADPLPFPELLTNLIVNKVLDWIAYKQGDNTNLKGVTDQDVQMLMNLML